MSAVDLLIKEGLATDVSCQGGTVGTFSRALAFPCGGGAWWSSREGRWIATYYSGTSRSCRHYAKGLGHRCESDKVARLLTDSSAGVISDIEAVAAIRQIFAGHPGPAMSPSTGKEIP